MRCGLLGRVLGHSYSPMIHGMLGQYSYDLFPTEPEALDALLRGDAWDGLNVTIPYKKTVVPYCAELSETAEKLGSVNTLVRRADGTIYGARPLKRYLQSAAETLIAKEILRGDLPAGSTLVLDAENGELTCRKK